MSVFKEVKEHIDADTVIFDYGVKIGRNGMACCPFHADKHPSMKVDNEHYHCFGCGAHGDAISFVAQMEGLSNYDAACKIIKDYRLPINTEKDISEEELSDYHKVQAQKKHITTIKKKFDKWVDDKIHELKECEALIEEVKESVLKTDPGAVFISNDFPYMLHKELVIDYWLDILCMGDDADKRSLFLEEREEVSRVATNIKRAGNEILGRNRKCVG